MHVVWGAEAGVPVVTQAEPARVTEETRAGGGAGRMEDLLVLGPSQRTRPTLTLVLEVGLPPGLQGQRLGSTSVSSRQTDPLGRDGPVGSAL